MTAISVPEKSPLPIRKTQMAAISHRGSLIARDVIRDARRLVSLAAAVIA